MDRIIPVYKPIGKTPLEMILGFKNEHSKYSDEKITYVGRLDPMAHGVMLLLTGPTKDSVNALKGLNKTYDFTLLLGLKTDTYDLLGIPQSQANVCSEKDVQLAIKSINNLTGKLTQPYPPYSSTRVKGKALFEWAKAGRLEEISIPTNTTTVYSSEVTNKSLITSEQLLNLIKKRVSKVSGDFRQKEIIKHWQENLQQSVQFPLLHATVSCSSGTYIRGICDFVGKEIGVGGLAFDICRTQVGTYTIEDTK